MKSLRSLILVTALALPLAACGGAEEGASADAAPAEEAVKEAPPKPAEMKAPGAEPKADGTAAPAAEDPLAEAREGYNPALLDPNKATEEAPAQFAVKFETTKGDIIIDVTREWAPHGADRFYNLVKIGFYDDTAMFRVIDGFMAQMGLHGDPAVNTVWRGARIAPDPVKGSNTAGMVTFAMAGRPDTRTTQIFMNFVDNKNLDGMGFAPFGKLRDMEVLNTIHSGYGEGAPRGRGPHQGMIQSKGNEYLKANFPDLDYIKKATLLEG